MSDLMIQVTAEAISANVLRLGAAASAASAGPALHYWGGSDPHWTAVCQCKPRGRRFRLIRGSGGTAYMALRDLARQLAAFERGERDGEQ